MLIIPFWGFFIHYYNLHRFWGKTFLRKYNKLVVVLVVSGKWDFLLVSNCSKYAEVFELKIMVAIVTIKIERECI